MKMRAVGTIVRAIPLAITFLGRSASDRFLKTCYTRGGNAAKNLADEAKFFFSVGTDA